MNYFASMIEFTFFSNIENFYLSDLTDCKTADYIISSNLNKKEAYYTDAFHYHLGRAESQTGRTNCYACDKWSHEATFDSENTPFHYLRKMMLIKMQYLESFLSMMWLVKDCSVYTKSCIGEIIGRNYVEKSETNTYARNFMGKMEKVSFSKDELKKLDIFIKYYALLGQEKELNYDDFKKEFKSGETLTIGRNKDFNYNNYSPLDRAFVFLSGARKLEYLPHRIAMYIPIFECLFTIDSTEVTHKVSERIAFYLSDDKVERKEIYTFMKQGYDFRSSFLHGNEFPKKLMKDELLVTLSKNIDEYARRAFTRIITEDSKDFLNTNEKGRKEYLNDIIFR